MSTSTMMSFIQPPLQLKPTFQEVQNWPTVLTLNSWNTNVSMPAHCAVCAKVYEVAQGDNNTISIGNTVVAKTWHLASMAFDEAVLGWPHHRRCDFNSFLLRQKFGQPAQDHMSGTNDGPSRLTGSIRNTTSLWHLGWTFLKVRTTPSSGTHHHWVRDRTPGRPRPLLFTFN